MDYGKSFTYLFEDKNWITKFLIGVVLSIIPIIQFATYGYLVEIIKNVRDGSKEPLPEWDNFGELFISGFKIFLGSMAYALPAILASFLFVPAAIIGGEEPGAVIQMFMISLSCVVMLFSFLPMLLMPALAVQFAEREQISDMFAISEIWAMIQADFASYFIILIFLAFVMFFVAGIGFLACFIGVFFTSWYAYLVGGHLVGQYAAEQP